MPGNRARRDGSDETMNRRSLLVAAGAIGLTTAVGGTGVALAEPESSIETALESMAGHRPQPVLLWELTGGFVPAGWNALRPARLAAYDDGVLIADATRRLRVSPGTLRSLRNHTTTVLRDPANARRRPGAPVVADVPWTVFTARTPGRRYSLRFEGLEETRQDRAYPTPVYSLLDHVTRLRDRTTEVGSAWRPDAVRMIAVMLDPAQPTGGTGTQPVPWPAGVPVPHPGKDEFVALLDLRGRQARALVRAVPHPDPAQWPVFRAPDGMRMQVNWRFLLPHE
ncbi:hypothetical protein GCM10010199_41920 [Dactylosporangium roseum]